MSKVLISFLGTAQPKERQYRLAKYHFQDGTEIESSFVAFALKSYYDVDRLILIGTVKSMWEEVYRTFAMPIDEDYYIRLSDHCLSSNHESELFLPEIEKLEEGLGDNSKVVLIKYGLTEEEIIQNSEIILQIEKYLNQDDELFVDITHSFRSLPLYLMNTLVYLQNVSKKKVKVGHITYGMLDVSEEMGYTPVVELNEVMTMNEWITGAYSFKEYGNAYSISELLKDSEAQSRLVKFSDLMNLNHLSGIEKQNQELAALKNREYGSSLAEMLINPIVQTFIETFNTKTHSEFQYHLAQWHFQHKNYSSAYIAMIECVVTYICEINNLDWGNFDQRQIVKEQLRGKKPVSRNHLVLKIPLELIDMYNEANKYRNSIAHSIPAKWNYRKMIFCLESSITEIGKIMK